MAPTTPLYSSRDEDAHLLGHEARLCSIIDTIPDAMIMIDERGHILSFSAAA